MLGSLHNGVAWLLPGAPDNLSVSLVSATASLSKLSHQGFMRSLLQSLDGCISADQISQLFGSACCYTLLKHSALNPKP